MLEQKDYAETNYVLLNVGQAGSPLQDQRVRCALAAAIDRKELVDVVAGGFPKVANGPFSPGQDGYLDDTGCPKYDPAEAADRSRRGRPRTAR